MSDRIRSQLAPNPALLARVLLGGGLANAMAAPAIGLWHSQGIAALAGLFGISPVMLLAAVSGVLALRDARVAPSRLHGAVAVSYALVLLLPSSLAAWLATGLYAGWIAANVGGRARLGALLVVGVTGCALWQIFADRLFGIWLMLPDAVVVQHALVLVRDGVVREGNVVGVPGRHQIVILAGCATLQSLPMVLLGVAAVAGGGGPRCLLRHAARVAIGFVAMNLCRLVVLAWSPAAYAAGHGVFGQNVFDGLTLALILLPACWNGQKPRAGVVPSVEVPA